MAVAGLLDYHGNPVRGRKGLIKIRANGASSAGSKQTLGKALSRSPFLLEFIGGTRGEPAGRAPSTGHSPFSLPPRNGYTIATWLLPIFIERSSFMAGRSSDRGVEREGDVFRRFHRDRFLEEEGRDLF